MSRFEPRVRWWSATARSLPQFAPAQRLHARRPMLESLEERAMLSTIALTVNTLADSGVGTLRSAITTSDLGAASNSYVIKFSIQGTIDLISALPDLSNNISIKGLGASGLTVQRDPNATPFSVFTVDSGETVSLSGVTIKGGESADYEGNICNADSGNGGGIWNVWNIGGEQ